MLDFLEGGDPLASLTAFLSAWCDAADRRDAVALCGFFAAPGRLVMGGATHEGHAAIAACLQGRLRASRQTRHLWSNLRVTALADGRLQCDSTQLTFEHDQGQVQTRLRVSDVSDVVRHDADRGWRFESRSVTRAMSLLATTEE